MKKYIFSLFCVFMFALSANAAVPNEIRYNGRLKSYQTPVNATVNMTFNLYYQDNGGSPAWTSGPVSVSVSSGFFTHDLKPTNIDWSKGGVWLGLMVEGNDLLPREKLMSQPYSFHAVTAENGVPPGTVIAFAGSTTTIPTGYLWCDGREVNISDYPDLHRAIGSIYGTASGGKFKLPNFQGVFLRGNGSTSITTSPGGTVTVASAALGVKQTDAIRNITGKFGQNRLGVGNDPNGHFVYQEGALYKAGYYGTQYASGSNGYGGGNLIGFNASNVVPTAAENRPVNYSVNYCIKY